MRWVNRMPIMSSAGSTYALEEVVWGIVISCSGVSVKGGLDLSRRRMKKRHGTSSEGKMSTLGARAPKRGDAEGRSGGVVEWWSDGVMEWWCDVRVFVPTD